MKRKALTERNGSLPEGEDVVREQDELFSTSSVSQDELNDKQPDSVKMYLRTHNHHPGLFAVKISGDWWASVV